MTATSYRTLAYLVAVSLAVPQTTRAQTVPPAPPAPAAPNATAQAPAQPVFRPEEIDQMVAAIALYPDQLLVQMFMASTYPLEIVQAERWVSDPANAKLKGEALDAALQKESWDPSVKSLVPFPPVLKMMSDKLEWTQRLGDAFLAQEKDVMASVQRLRREAQANGNLKSTPEQIVSIEPAVQATAGEGGGAGGGSSPPPPPLQQPAPPPEVQQLPVSDQQTIVIQPADPQTVYVPTYNPSDVYGPWPYPSYPPYYYPPAPAYYPGYGLAAAGVGFLTGMAVGGALWGWGNANWNGGTVNINGDRYNNINSGNIRSGRATQLPANTNNWRHDSSHRAGVAYRDQGTRQNFQRNGANQTAASRDFRGYDRSGAGSNRQAAANRAGAGTANRANAGAGNRAGAGTANRAGAGAANRANAGAANRPTQAAARSATGAGAGQRQAGAAGGGAAARSGASGVGGQRTQNAGIGAGGGLGGLGQSGASARQPSAFQGMGSGSQVRAQSNRGRSSLQSSSGVSGRSASSARSGGGGRSFSGGGGGGRGGGGGGGGRGGGRR